MKMKMHIYTVSEELQARLEKAAAWMSVEQEIAARDEVYDPELADLTAELDELASLVRSDRHVDGPTYGRIKDLVTRDRVAMYV